MSSLKRKDQGVTEDGAPYIKRQRPSLHNEDADKAGRGQKRSTYNGGSSTSRADATTGQKPFFPGLDDGDNEELFYGPASDGLEYLRMVRTEARGVPDLLVSADQAFSESDAHKGWYSDGAYIAWPVLGPQLPTPARRNEAPEVSYNRRNSSSQVDEYEIEDDRLDTTDDSTPLPTFNASRTPQSVYHEKLLSEFRSQRDHLHQSPPQDLLEAATSSDLLADLVNPETSLSLFKRNLYAKPPSPLQLALMDVETVLEALEIFTSRCVRRSKHIRRPPSAWIWGLLARLAGWMGQLRTEDIGVVRALAKMAKDWVSVVEDRPGDHGKKLEDEVEDGEAKEIENDDGTSVGDAEGENLLLNTRVTLDMILTVVGEVFGQRDLLEFREIW
ncbi:hypothetical protein EV356DRAFT_570414 [Viridothelium virens]|uniref:Uncharacterized protein n=1 Tax=Viridothelium virens TaxID=1048519 RepID=A0A6A6GWY1_VIRVR|nr:hypothetical protein EV356DRAFT_570414 [Viridothelium virens]